LNILLDGGFMAEVQVARLKRGLARIFRTDLERVNLYVQYARADDTAKKAHWLS
jgi:hypothetical protein